MSRYKIIVLSCDKNEDLFEPFYQCMEKYWPDHPEVIYSTETVINPYYETIAIPRTIESWTAGIRKFLYGIAAEKVLLMMDDCFVRCFVDVSRIEYACNHFTDNIAMFNFEKSWDSNDLETDLVGFKKRQHGSRFEVSLMCGLWDKQKLLTVLQRDSTPWDVEEQNISYGYDYYINSGDYIIDWGYRTWKPANVMKGRWAKEIIPFFEQEGIVVNYSKRGFYD